MEAVHPLQQAAVLQTAPHQLRKFFLVVVEETLALEAMVAMEEMDTEELTLVLPRHPQVRPHL